MSKGIVWKDVSSYSRGDIERIPRSWQCNVDDLRIVVTRIHGNDKNEWFLKCEPWFGCYLLGVVMVDEAKKAAIKLVRAKLHAAYSAMENEI